MRILRQIQKDVLINRINKRKKMKDLTKEQKQLIELSEGKNPYSSDCPNRQLWSEGFRAGVKHKSLSLNTIRRLMQDEYDKKQRDTNDGFLDRFAQVIYDNM